MAATTLLLLAVVERISSPLPRSRLMQEPSLVRSLSIDPLQVVAEVVWSCAEGAEEVGGACGEEVAGGFEVKEMQSSDASISLG